MSLSWTHQIAKALASGRPTLAMELHLDALLVWLSNPDNPRAAELAQAIERQRLTRDQAGASAHRLLDQQLFAGDALPSPTALGFAPGTEAKRAKQRYRRLMQVYHPDRHPDRTAWATRRTEQINRAFAAFQRGEPGTARTGARKAQGHRDTEKPSIWRLPPVWLPTVLRDLIAPAWVWTHDRWGVLTPLQQRLLNTAAIAFVLMLTIALWPEEAPKPVPRIIHHPLGIEPTPAPVDDPMPAPEPPPFIAATEPTPFTPEPSSPQETMATAAVGSKPAPETPPESGANTAAPVAPVDRSTAQPVTSHAPQPLPASPEPRATLAPRADIPPAATPEPPKPPVPPATPLALRAAPAVPNATLTSASIATRCHAAAEILNRFQNAYQHGALDQFMALYSPLAKENELTTWFAIRQTYAEWFRTTSSRSIGFEQIQVQPIADSRRCAVMAVFQVSYLDRQSRLVTQAGIIELLLEHSEADWLILRARY
jgi:hypothetical protein